MKKEKITFDNTIRPILVDKYGQKIGVGAILKKGSTETQKIGYFVRYNPDFNGAKEYYEFKYNTITREFLIKRG